MNAMTHDDIIYRLEEAGATLLSLPPGAAVKPMPDAIKTALESYGWDRGRTRPQAPNDQQLARMEQAMGWLDLIPQDRYVLRRIVGARSLVHPITDRHLFPWRRLAAAMGADHKAVQRWHWEGVYMIELALGDRT